MAWEILISTFSRQESLLLLWNGMYHEIFDLPYWLFITLENYKKKHIMKYHMSLLMAGAYHEDEIDG